MSTTRRPMRPGSSKQTLASTARTTTATAIMITPAPSTADDSLDATLEEVDLDKQSQVTDEPDLTTEPLTTTSINTTMPMATMTVTTMTPRRRPGKTLTKKASQAPAGGKNLTDDHSTTTSTAGTNNRVHQKKNKKKKQQSMDSTTKVPSTNGSFMAISKSQQGSNSKSDSTTVLSPVTYQVPQVILPPPQLSMNPLAALTNLLPLLQMLNRPAPLFYQQLSQMASQTAGVGGIKNSVSRPQQLQQQQEHVTVKPMQYQQVPHYSVPQYGISSPYYLPHVYTQQLANMSAASTTTPTPLIPTPLSRPMSLPQMIEPLAEKPNSANSNIANPGKKTHFQRKPQQKPTLQLGGSNQQLPNIATTIRTMMHLLNANNLMLAGNNANRNSKKHRMPKFVDVNDPSYELDNQRFPSNTKYDSNKYYNNSGKRRGEWGKQQELRHDNSTQDKFLMDPVARALDTFKSRAMTNSQSRFVTSESARTKPMVSSALTHKYNDKVTLYDEDLPSGFPQLSDKVDSHFLKPIMGRRMDINVVDENDDANVLGRTIGAESNYKMLIGLLTGALSRRRDFRSLAKQTQRQFDIEKSRQMANNMVMRSLLYSPLPMYQRLPSRVAWPMVQQPSSSLSAAGPQRPPINLVHNIPSATITIGGRPVLYGKHLVDRPRQPRYYFFDGVPRKGHTISRFNERDLKSVEETFDTTFPSAPIKSTFRSIERPMTAAVSLPLTSQTPAKQTAATVKNDTPLETSSSEGLFPIQKPLNFLGGLSVRQQTLSAPPKHQPNADQRQQNFSMEIPYLNTSLPAGVRIVIPTTTSTTMAPSPVIKFTNRIGDRRTRRSTTNQTGPLDRDPSMIHPIYQVKINPFVYAQGLLATKKGQANVNNKPAVPFFEFVGEVRQGNSSDLNSSTALRRSCTSPEQAFLQVNDWNDLLYSTEFRSGFDESEASISSTTPYRYDQRRPVRAIENSEIDDFSRCFYPNTTFSTMLNCNDDIYSCNRGTRSREGCSCDDDCVMFGDCCWDKVSELQKEFGSLADIEYSRERLKLLTCVRSNRNISYHMISKCDPSWKNYPESELCSGSHPEDALLQIPVTSKKTLNTYRNIVCAHCHDDVLDLVFWEVEFHCRKQLQTFSVHRAIGNCPFGTNPPASLTRKEKQFAARPCNPNVDYETSTDLECEHISANESATIRAPSRHVANRLAVMCDLIYLPTINVGVSKCDSVFYRNRFCALCRRHLTRDLRCPVNAAMPMHLDSGELSDENETKFYLNLRWQNSDVLCDKADHTFDPWKKGCRQIFYGKSLPRCDGSGPGSLANNPMSYFLVRQTWFSYVSIGCLVLTIVSYCFGCVDSKIHPFESGPSPVDNIILCLVSSLLGAQLLFHVSITKNNCHTRFTCVYFGVAFHFCTISCFAWTNVLLHKVWTYLKYAAENSDKRLSTFFAGYCLYAWIFPAVTVGIASFTNLTLDSNDRISPCYGCHGICFISNLPAFWLFLGIPLIYAVSINIVRFAEVFQECRNQTEEAMYHCMARLPFRSVISAILLATLIPLTWALALTAVSLHNERAWLTFLFCYACHGPMCLLLSGAVFRYLRPFRRIRVLLTSVQLCTIDHTACRVGAKTSSANEADSDQSRNPFVKPGKRDKEGRSQQLR